MFPIVPVFSLMLGSANASYAYPIVQAPLTEEEQTLYKKLNEFRGELNLPRLRLNDSLRRVAQKQSRWQESIGHISHFGPNNEPQSVRALFQHYAGTWNGETVACGFSTGLDVLKAWAQSGVHLVTILNPNFRDIGISMVGDGSTKCPYYWSAEFGSFIDYSEVKTMYNDIAEVSAAYEKVLGPLDGKVLTLPGLPERRKRRR